MNRAMRLLRTGIASSKPKSGAHLHWRLIFDGINDPQNRYVTIAEINFRETPGSNSLMNGTISASTFYQAGYEANKAVDGNLGTAWICGQNLWNGSWWRMSTVAKRNVKQLALQAFNTTAGAGQMPKDFRLQYSDDGTNWFTKTTITNQTAWAASELRLFTV